MPEYIEREAVKRALAESGLIPRYRWGGYASDAIVDRVPAADVVEVVRCRNCYWFAPDEVINTQTGRCAHCEMVKFFDDFCSYGERRDKQFRY